MGETKTEAVTLEQGLLVHAPFGRKRIGKVAPARRGRQWHLGRPRQEADIAMLVSLQNWKVKKQKGKKKEKKKRKQITENKGE